MTEFSKLALLGMLAFVVLIFILGHIAERDSTKKISDWRWPE